MTAIRDDIVEAAVELFSKRGYHGASMQDIAEVAGMRKASLYHHVRRKEDLLFGIHDRLIDQLVAGTEAAVAAGETPGERVRLVLREAMRLVADSKREVRVFLHDADALEGERWEAIVAKRDRYERMVVEVLRDGVAEGAFVPMDAELSTRGILAMANWGYTWFDPAGELSADEVADAFTAIVLHGIVPR